jgi:hypothetical protein
MLALLLAAAVSVGCGENCTNRSTLPTPELTCRVRNYHGAVVRSMTRRRKFLLMIGQADGKLPDGFVVNHIVPLRCGGCDLPSNMELMTVEAWKRRTGPEAKDCGRHPDGAWMPAAEWMKH